MNLREALDKVLSEWPIETQKPFSENLLAAFFRNDFVHIVKKIVGDINPNFLYKASAGAGNWANIPWLSILDPRITNTTQEGIYPVYLFRSDGAGVYLSLNQGTTNPTKAIGKEDAVKRAKKIAKFIQEKTTELSWWDTKPLNLMATTPLGRSYEEPNIASKFYSINSLPTNDELEHDLKEIIQAYEEVVKLWPYVLKDDNLIESPENNKQRSINKNMEDNYIPLPKPFLLLAGISGTGKTRFVRVQAERSNGGVTFGSGKPNNYELIAVRPDWHEPSDLLGYVSRINGVNYVPTAFLIFIVKAWQEVFAKGGSLHITGEGTRPFWLCLDEMNLAPVEQYFADYLSILESRKWDDEGYSCLPLISDDLELVKKAIIKKAPEGDSDSQMWTAFLDNGGIPIPPNLIIAGTVNMDETTHGFSRKVIDRALTLDFQEFFPNRFDEFFTAKSQPALLGFSTIVQISSADELSHVKADTDGSKSIAFLREINRVLKSTPFELAYRALNELLVSLACFSPDNESALIAVWDDFLMQKVLPRLEGDAEKLQYNGEESSGLLNRLRSVISNQFQSHSGIEEGSILRPDILNRNVDGGDAKPCHSKSLHKIDWMQQRLENNQYTSFWA